MRWAASMGIALLMGGLPALAQGVPDSNMGKPSGNTGSANNGVGHEGSLTANAGSHSSTVSGPGAAAEIATAPKPRTASGGDPQVETDPSQGGSKPH